MENKPKFHPNQNLKLMDQVREVLRYYHYAYRTETTYCQWILRYIHFYGGQTHPQELGAKHIRTISFKSCGSEKCCCFDPASSFKCSGISLPEGS